MNTTMEMPIETLRQRLQTNERRRRYGKLIAVALSLALVLAVAGLWLQGVS